MWTEHFKKYLIPSLIAEAINLRSDKMLEIHFRESVNIWKAFYLEYLLFYVLFHNNWCWNIFIWIRNDFFVRKMRMLEAFELYFLLSAASEIHHISEYSSGDFFSVFRRKFHDLTTPLDSKFIVWRMLWECVEKFIVHKTIAGWEIEANDLRWSFPNDKVFRLFNTVRLFIILGCFAPNF